MFSLAVLTKQSFTAISFKHCVIRRKSQTLMVSIYGSFIGSAKRFKFQALQNMVVENIDSFNGTPTEFQIVSTALFFYSLCVHS